MQFFKLYKLAYFIFVFRSYQDEETSKYTESTCTYQVQVFLTLFRFCKSVTIEKTKNEISHLVELDKLHRKSLKDDDETLFFEKTFLLY